MKTYIPYSLILATASCGVAFGAATAYTTPVGYETLPVTPGFNYLGVRLHNPVLAAGTVDTISPTQMTSAATNFGAIMTGGSATTYLVEFVNGSGAIQEVTGASASGSTITLPENVTSLVSAGAKFRIRAASTIASIFGAVNPAGITPGYSGPTDADVLYVPGAGGVLTQYFYDADNATWTNAKTNLAVNAASVALVYTDAVALFAQKATSVVISGQVITNSVLQSAIPGFNYLGTVYPVGSTLATAFGANTAAGPLHPGYSGPTDADVVYVPAGAGFTQYYYDADNGTWANAQTNLSVVASSISLPSAVIYFNAKTGINLLDTPPAYYSSL